MSRFTGVDVGARRVDAISIDERGTVVSAATFSADRLGDLQTWLVGSAVIAIDAPESPGGIVRPEHLALGLGPKFLAARCAEIDLGRRFRIWVPWVTPPLQEASQWMRVGFQSA